MTNWASILYRGYWDFPRIFLVRHEGDLYLFDGMFQEELDDYPDDFRVHLMPQDLNPDDLPNDWTVLPTLSRHCLGTVPVSQVKFDPTRRKEVDLSVFEQLPHRPPVASAIG